MRRSWLLVPSLLVACAGDPEPATSQVGMQLTDVAKLRVQGGTLTRQRQVIDGLPVYRHELRTLTADDGRIVAQTGRLFDAKIPRSRPRFVDDEASAIEKGIPATTRRLGETRARQVWYPHRDSLIAAWVVEAYVDDDLRRTIIAANGDVISSESLVADAAFTYRVFAESTGEKHPYDGPIEDATPHPTGVPDGVFPAYVGPQLVTVESLNKNNDPWLPEGATQTSGNNVDAYVDIATPDGLTGSDFRATTTSPGVFDHAYDTLQGPLASQEQQKASVTSLFYVINWLHDFWYDAGFDEAAGNAQRSNYGRPGLEDDVLLAEAQDRALDGSRNNANMATPDDGMSPRMQVFLWTGPDIRDMTLSPSGRTPRMGGASFGPRDFQLTGEIVLGQDGMGMNPTDGCTPYTNSIAGLIVLVDRGNCTFKLKTRHAQEAGAIGVIVANNVAATNPPTLGDDSAIQTEITIPAMSVTQAEGAAIKADLLAGPVTVTVHSQTVPELDGALDSTLIAHEFGHYLHHRLTFCGNAMCRALSEGWGDFTALMLLARAGDDLTGAYPFSIYSTQSYGDDAAYFGIRRAPYSVDFGINSLSFRHMADGVPLPMEHPFQPSNTNSEVHNAGEIWTAALWEVYVALQQDGQGKGLTFEQVRDKMARYVVTGLSLTPVEASPMEARDAILAAALAADPADHAVMTQAFARRGFGSCAVPPPDNSVDFVGIVESTLVAGKPELGSLALADGCDEDNILDTGETAKVVVKVVNQGHAPLTDVTFAVTSQLPGVTVLSPPSSLPRLEPFATTQLELDVALEPGLTTGVDGDLALEVTASGGCTQTVKLPIATRLNVDDVPASSTVDTFNTERSAWQAWAIAWSHVRATPLDGYWHADDLPIVSDTRLTSPSLLASSTKPVTMSFTHRYSFEMSNDTAFDGGVIEYSIDDGTTWEDISVLADPGYSGMLAPNTANVLLERAAFVGSNPSWPEVDTVSMNLGTALAGKTFLIRFRLGTDSGTGAPGWDIDDVAFEGLANTPFPAQIADDGNCEPTPDDPITSGGGGCCDSSRSTNGVFALFVLALVGRRRRSGASLSGDG